MKKHSIWLTSICLGILATAFVGVSIQSNALSAFKSSVLSVTIAHADDEDEDTIAPPPPPPAPPTDANYPTTTDSTDTKPAAVTPAPVTTAPTPSPAPVEDAGNDAEDSTPVAPYSDAVPTPNTPETPVEEVNPQPTTPDAPSADTVTGFWSFIPFVNKAPKTPTAITPTVPDVRKTPVTKKPLTASKKKSYDVVSIQYTLNGVLVHTSEGPDDNWQLDTKTLQNGTYTLNTFINYADGTSDNGNNTFTVDNTPTFLDKVKNFVKGLLALKKQR